MQYLVDYKKEETLSASFGDVIDMKIEQQFLQKINLKGNKRI